MSPPDETGTDEDADRLWQDPDGLLEAGNLLYAQHERAAAGQLWQRAADLLTGHAEHTVLWADVQCNLATIHWHRRELVEADTCYRRALAVYVDSGRDRQAALTQLYLGNVAHHRGELTVARTHIVTAISALRRIGSSSRDIADGQSNLAAVTTALGDHAHALDLLDNAAALYRRVVADDELAAKLDEIDLNRGLALMEAAELDDAVELLTAVVAWRQANSAPIDIAYAVHNLANATRRAGRYADAAAAYQTAIAIFERDDLTRDETADCELGLGGVSTETGQDRDAIAHHRRAADIYRRTGEWIGYAQAVHNIGLAEQNLTGQGTPRLLAAWLALHSFSTELVTVNERQRWHEATAAALPAAASAAHALDGLLLCELIEAARSVSLRPNPLAAADDEDRDADVAEPPTTVPPMIQCGPWETLLGRAFVDADAIRRIGGSSPPARSGRCALSTMLTP